MVEVGFDRFFEHRPCWWFEGEINSDRSIVVEKVTRSGDGYRAAGMKIGGGLAAAAAQSGGVWERVFLPKNTLTEMAKLLDQNRQTA